MFTQPAGIVGIVIFAAGWAMLLMGGFTGAALVNIHSLWIASAMIISGCAFMVMGSIASAAEQLIKSDSVRTPTVAGRSKPNLATTDANEIDPDTLHRALQEKGLR